MLKEKKDQWNDGGRTKKEKKPTKKMWSLNKFGESKENETTCRGIWTKKKEHFLRQHEIKM